MSRFEVVGGPVSGEVLRFVAWWDEVHAAPVLAPPPGFVIPCPVCGFPASPPLVRQECPRCGR